MIEISSCLFSADPLWPLDHQQIIDMIYISTYSLACTCMYNVSYYKSYYQKRTSYVSFKAFDYPWMISSS